MIYTDSARAGYEADISAVKDAYRGTKDKVFDAVADYHVYDRKIENICNGFTESFEGVVVDFPDVNKAALDLELDLNFTSSVHSKMTNFISELISTAQSHHESRNAKNVLLDVIVGAISISPKVTSAKDTFFRALGNLELFTPGTI